MIEMSAGKYSHVPHTPLINWWVEKPFGAFVIALHPEYIPTDRATTIIVP